VTAQEIRYEITREREGTEGLLPYFAAAGVVVGYELDSGKEDMALLPATQPLPLSIAPACGCSGYAVLPNRFFKAFRTLVCLVAIHDKQRMDNARQPEAQRQDNIQ